MVSTCKWCRNASGFPHQMSAASHSRYKRIGLTLDSELDHRWEKKTLLQRTPASYLPNLILNTSRTTQRVNIWLKHVLFGQKLLFPEKCIYFFAYSGNRRCFLLCWLLQRWLDWFTISFVIMLPKYIKLWAMKTNTGTSWIDGLTFNVDFHI